MLREEAQRAGLEMVIPKVIPKSRRALEAAEYARQQGQHEAFHKLVFHKFYGEGQDLSDWRVVLAAAEEVGLDTREMQRKTEEGQYASIIDRRMAELRALGATGVPLYIFEGKYAVIGLQPYDAFQEVMEHIETDNKP